MEKNLQEINERLERELADYKQREERYRAIFQQSEDGFALIDGSGFLIEWNPSFENITGLNTNELKDKYFWDILRYLYSTIEMPEELRSNMKSQIIQCLSTGKAPWLNRFDEWDFDHPNGERKTIQLIPFIIHTSYGYMLSSIIRDVTKNKQTYNALKASEEKYKLLFNNANDAIYLHELSVNGKPGKILEVNNVAIERLGFSRDEFSSLSIYDIKSSKSRLNVPEMLDVLIKKEHATFESIHETKDGKLIPVEISAHVFILNGEKRVLSISRDISDRKKAEKQIRASEALYESILRVAPVGIGVLVDRKLIFVSQSFLDMVGYTQEELLGQSSRVLYLNDEEYERVGKEKYTEITSTGSGSIDTKFLCKNGAIIEVDLRLTPIDPSNHSKGVTFTALDISERKMSESAIRLSKEKYKNIFNSSPFGMHNYQLLDDGNLVFIDANLSANRITGVDSSQFVGKTIEEAFPPLKETEIPSQYKRVAKEGKTWRLEQIDYEDDQIAGIYEVVAFQTEKMKMVASFWDITDKELAKRNLEESRERYQQVVTNMSEGIWIINRDLKTTFVNPALERMLGYTQSEMLDKPVANFLTKESAEMYTTIIEDRFTYKIPRGMYELTFKHKFGAKIVTRVISTMLNDAHGEIVGSFGLISDVTKQKQLDEAKKDLDRRRSEFIALASHEIRTPITIIKGYLDILKGRYEQLSDEIRFQCFDRSEKQIQRLANLITGVSAITKIERGIFTLKFEEIDFISFVREILDDYTYFQENRFSYNIKSDEEIFPMKIDTERMTQVLSNVIGNSINHTRSKTREIRVLIDLTLSDKVKIEIKDNGAGIHPDKLEEIFEPFVSIPSEFTAQGTGIGLYLSRVIVEGHHGKIYAESQGSSTGSIFTIEFPK